MSALGVCAPSLVCFHKNTVLHDISNINFINLLCYFVCYSVCGVEKMPYYCTVPRCTSMAGKAKNVSFHQFPRDEELAKLWNKILKRGKPYTKYSKVCSLHFKPEDYTITSVGKNKGQWRTLRKDAIPSQNLPSESPTPYHRKQWSSWSTTPSINTNLQQQMAQAIYMQTMIAMQAANTADMSPLANEGTPSTPTLQETPHSSTDTPNANTPTSYKCTDCSKCFKDPDVFILHKRGHKKNEKENFNTNTLKSNPILANLLKTNTENHIFDNAMSMENLLITALAANLDYIRKMSMIKTETPDYDNHNEITPDNHNELTPDNHNGLSLPNGFSPHNHNGYSSHNHNGFSLDNGIPCENHTEYSSNNSLGSTHRISSNNHNEYSPNPSDNHNDYSSHKHNGFTHNHNGIIESHNENTPPINNDRTNETKNNENSDNFDSYRIDVKCTDFQVHDKGFLDLRNKKNDSCTKNDRFARNNSCDNDELNESFDSNNLVIDENV